MTIVRRSLSWSLPYAVAAAAAVIACWRHVLVWHYHAFRAGSGYPSYNLAVLTPNYWNSGFIRRGLGGTLLALFDTSQSSAGLFRFHVFLAIFLAVPLALLVRRLAAHDFAAALAFAVVLLVSPQTFSAFALDPARLDMLTLGFIAWALLAALDHRYVPAALIIFVGSLAHEATVIFGVPLIATLWWLDYRGGGATRRQGLLAAATLAVLWITAMVATQRFGAGQPAIAATIVNFERHSLVRDMAAYTTSTGFRAVKVAACQSLMRPSLWLDFGMIFLTLGLYLALLARRWRDVPVLAAVSAVPLVALSLIANDYGRWLMLAVMMALFAALALRLRSEPEAMTRRDYAVGAAILVILLALGPTRYYYADRATEQLARGIWGAGDVDFERELATCDPAWRSFIRPH